MAAQRLEMGGVPGEIFFAVGTVVKNAGVYPKSFISLIRGTRTNPDELVGSTLEWDETLEIALAESQVRGSISKNQLVLELMKTMPGENIQLMLVRV